MAGLVPCPACGSLVRRNESHCPMCEATIGQRFTMHRSASAMIVMGLALTGCPDRSTDDTSESGASMSEASTNTMTSESATESDASASMSESTAIDVGPLYGIAESSGSDMTSTSTTSSGSDTDTDTGTGTDATGTDSATETAGTDTMPSTSALYGVAET